MARTLLGCLCAATALFACAELAPADGEATERTAALERRPSAGAPPWVVFVGSHDSGDPASATGSIHVLALDVRSGALSTRGSVARDDTNQIDHPTFLAFDRRRGRLYAVSENYFDPTPFESSLSAFAYDAGAGALSLLNTARTGYAFDPFSFSLGAVHLTLDRRAAHLLVAIYDDAHGGGTVQSYALGGDGQLGARTGELSVGANAHQVQLVDDDRRLLVPALGADAVYQLEFSPRTGALSATSTPRVETPIGSGPRHLAVSADERFAYLVSERDASIAVYALSHGRLASSPLARYPTLPEDAASHDRARAAEVQISPDCSGLVLVSTRLDVQTGPDAFSALPGYVSAFRADPRTGKLTRLAASRVGSEPRHFSISPDGRFAVVASRDSDEVASYAVTARTGALSRASAVTIPHPAFAGVFSAAE